MNFFKIDRSLQVMRGITQYEGRDRESGELIEVTVGYSKGGTNWNTGKQNPRGIYVRFAEVTVEKTAYGESTSFMMFGSGPEWGNRSNSFFLEKLSRGNPAKLAAWAEKLDAKMPAACAAYRNLEPADMAMLRATFENMEDAA